MTYEPGDNIGIWVDQARVDMINEFDAFYRMQYGSEYSFGDQTKAAMALKLTVDQALRDAGLELDERGKRAYVRQLILDDAGDE